jgi:hypothetical protein
MITGFGIQDTIKPKFILRINTDKLIPDSVFRKLDEVPAHIRNADSAKTRTRTSQPQPVVYISDTTSVCSRNSLADVTFYDSLSFVRNLEQNPSVQFPGLCLKNSQGESLEKKLTIIRNLREGDYLPARPLHHDWITVVMILLACLYLIARASTKKTFTEFTGFLLFRGINESYSRNIGALFSWQSTILNFITFVLISLFCYSVAEYYSLISAGKGSFLSMIITLGIFIFSVTSRHFICLAAGNLSGEPEVFNEYLFTVYQAHRFSSILISFLLVLAFYSVFLQPEVYLVTGIIVLIIFYLYRVTRLFLIFMKRNISIIYLILYLCALEILPVLILVKYFTGPDS